LENCLSQAGYHLDSFTSALQALPFIEQEQPGLVLLDVKMQGLNGLDACRQLKCQAATANIPVIFVTSADDTPSIVDGFEVSAVDYITKPIRLPELLVRVQTHLAVHRLERELVSVRKPV